MRVGGSLVDLPSRINGLDLFSGIGGITLALAPWVRPVAYCESDPYAQAVLISRMRSGDLPVAPIWDDVRTLQAHNLTQPIDIIYGGFPCQDISVAGTGKGLAGKRSGLFFEIVRLVEEIRPTFVFLENVPAIRTRGLSTVVQELSDRWYDCRWQTLSAQEVGAPHKRDRWFMLAAHSDRVRLREQSRGSGRKDGKSPLLAGNYGEEVLANASSGRRGGTGERQVELARGAETISTGEALADADGLRELQPQGSIKELWDRTGDGSETLADSESIGRLERWTKPTTWDGIYEFARSSGDVADTDSAGLEIWLARNPGKQPSPFGESWWESEPGLGGTPDGLPGKLDGGLYGICDAEAEARAEEVLRDMRRGNVAETVQRATGGLDCVSAAEVLLSIVREYEEGHRLPRQFVEGETTLDGIMRAMRERRESSRAPLRRGSLEQYFREHPNALRVMSRMVASRGETAWSNPLWEVGVPRVATGIPNRVDRIRSLGNAVVPRQAQEAFKSLMGIV